MSRPDFDELLRDLVGTRFRYEALRAAGVVSLERSLLRSRLHALRSELACHRSA